MSFLRLAALSFGGILCLGSFAQDAASPWILDNPEYAPGRFGEALRMDFWRSRLFLKAPGCFPQKEGTVQLWVCPLADAVDFGNYGVILSSSSSQPQHKMAQLGMAILPLSDVRGNALSLGINSTSPGRVLLKPLPWKRGDWRAVAFTWGPSGLRLFVDGSLVSESKGAVCFDEVPEFISFGGGTFARYRLGANCLLDEIEISDCVRPDSYIKAYASGSSAPSPDEHTMALRHCDSSEGQGYWRMTDAYRASSAPFAIAGSGFLSDCKIFQCGSAPSLPASLVNPSSASCSFDVEADVSDYWGFKTAKARKSFELQAGSSLDASVSPGLLPPGWYKYGLRVSCSGRKLFEAARSFVVLPALPKGFLDSANFFGDHVSGIRKTDVFAIAGVPWERDMESFIWSCVEPEKDSYDWRAADFAVKEAAKNGQKLLAILGHPPYWAGEPPANASEWKSKAGVNRLGAHAPRSMEEFSKYVFDTVSRYKESVKHWEIWNEPDWNQPQYEGVGFTGDNAKYLEVLKTAFAAAKKADPDCVVVSGGFVPHPHLVGYLAKNGGGDYFDVLGMHRYRPWTDFLKYRALFPSKPCWQTEKMVVEPFEVCSEAMTAMNEGLGKYFLFDSMTAMNDFKGNGGFEAYGWDPQPVYFATASCVQKLGARKSSERLKFDRFDNLNRSLLLDKGLPSQAAAVFFDYKGPNKVKISFSAPEASKILLSSMMGKTREAVSSGGSRIEAEIDDILFVEGPFDPSSFRVSSFDEGSLLSNPSFSDLEGDIGIDKFAGMKPKGWDYREEGGKIELVKEGSGNALKLSWGGKGSVRVNQRVCFPSPGVYKISAEFKALPSSDGAKPAPFVSLYNPETGAFLPKELEACAQSFKRLSATFKIKPGEEHMTVSFGLLRGCSLVVKSPEAMRALDEELVKRSFFVDLSRYANQALSDGVKDDGKGGFGDLGPDNLSLMKTGLRELAGSVFKIEESSGSACLMLGRSSRKGLPLRVDGVKVGRKLERLQFLHTAMYVGAKPGEELGEYLIHLSDGSVAVHKLLRGSSLDDWYPPLAGPGVKVAEEVYSPSGLTHDVFFDEWVNPDPSKAVDSIDFVSNGKGMIAVLAVTGVVSTP